MTPSLRVISVKHNQILCVSGAALDKNSSVTKEMMGARGLDFFDDDED